jgi:energy-coupling factor transporter ATP-binding protein EcfA2
MRFEYNYSVIAVIAGSQCGKTTLTKYLVKDVPKDKVYVIDDRNQYSGYPHVTIPRQHNDQVLNSFIRDARSHAPCCMVIDDIDNYVRNSSEGSELTEYAISGKARGVGCVFQGRRMKFIDSRLWQNVDVYYFGLRMNERDLEDMSSFTNINFDEKMEASYKSMSRNAARKPFLKYDVTTGESQVIAVPEAFV